MTAVPASVRIGLLFMAACGAGRPAAPATPVPDEPVFARFVRRIDQLPSQASPDGSVEGRLVVGAGSIESERAAMAWLRVMAGRPFGAVHPCFDMHTVLLAGEADAMLVSGPQRLGPGDAVHVPHHVPFAFVPSTGPLELLQVFAAREGVTACDTVARGTTDLQPRETGLVTAQAVVRAAEAPWFPIGEGRGRVQVLVDEEVQGARLAALGRLEGEPGLTIAAHVHDGSDELLWIEAGRGRLTIAGATLVIEGGMVVRIPAGTEHSLVVDAPLRAVQAFAGADADERFRAARQAAH